MTMLLNIVIKFSRRVRCEYDWMYQNDYADRKSCIKIKVIFLKV